MRIDSHHHLWDLTRRPQPWTDELPTLQRSFTYAELEPLLASAQVDGALVVQTVASIDETHELLAMATECDRLWGVIGWLDLTVAGLADDIARTRELTGGDYLVGVRHQLQVEPDPEWIVRPEVLRSLRTLGDAGLTYDFVVSPHQLATVVAAVDAAPSTRFVIDHGGKPRPDAHPTQWHCHMRELAQRANVTVKVSGTETDWAGWAGPGVEPPFEALLRWFGADRLMWGSDWPVSLLTGGNYSRWVELSEKLFCHLSVSESAALWGMTAQREYSLRASP